MTSSINLVLGSLPEARLDDTTADLLHRGMPGVTLFREANIDSADQVSMLCADIHAASSELPALIAVDQEGGQLQALSGVATDFPGNLALAAAGDPDLTERVGHAVGLELRALGVTVNYAPVCDLLTNATNHGLSIRSFGDNPVTVAAHAAATVIGLQRAGVAATAKHFPGKGAAEVDTHYAQAVIDRSRQQFETNELVPFRSAMEADVKLAMTSHAIIPALSPNNPRPATLSPEIMTTLLRVELGFEGVTITDALDMAGVGVDNHASALESLDAIRAGSDLLLSTTKMNLPVLIADLEAGLLEHPIDSAQLSASAERVIELRRWLSAFTPRDLSIVGSQAHRDLADSVARQSLTEYKAGPDRRPVESNCVVLQPSPTNLTEADTTDDATVSLAAELRSLGVSPSEYTTRHSPTLLDIELATDAARDRDTIIVVTAAATESGQVDLVNQVQREASRTTVVIARNPLDLNYIDLTESTRALCSYGLTASTVRALGSLLVSGLRPQGTLPVGLTRR